MIVKVQKIASKEIYVHIKNVTKNLTSHSIKYILLSHIFREYSLKELNCIWKRITKFVYKILLFIKGILESFDNELSAEKRVKI